MTNMKEFCFIFKRYALKTQYFFNAQDRAVILNEIKLMQMIDHPHIVKYYGDFLHSNDIQCILIELCEVFFE